MLGSLAVTGPVGIAIAFWLLAGKSWRLTLSWCLLFGAGMALVVLTKLAFIGWGLGVASVEFAGFSGHAMRAAAVFPVAFYLASRHTSLPVQRCSVAAGVVLAMLISISRVPVLAHSVSEAFTGCVLGLAVAAAFIWLAQSERHIVFGRALAALCIPALLIAPHAEPVPTERWMTQLALYLSGRDHPYTRHDWKVRPQIKAAATRF